MKVVPHKNIRETFLIMLHRVAASFSYVSSVLFSNGNANSVRYLIEASVSHVEKPPICCFDAAKLRSGIFHRKVKLNASGLLLWTAHCEEIYLSSGREHRLAWNGHEVVRVGDRLMQTCRISDGAHKRAPSASTKSKKDVYRHTNSFYSWRKSVSSLKQLEKNKPCSAERPC